MRARYAIIKYQWITSARSHSLLQGVAQPMSAPVSSAPETAAPGTVIDVFDASRRASAQRAAEERRLEPAAVYTFEEEQQPRASLVGVVGGIIGFITFLCAIWLASSTYLARIHHGDF